MSARLSAFAAMLSLTALPALSQEPAELRVMSYNIWYGGVQVSFPATIDAIRAADADVVGLQEPDGNTARIAEAAGYPYVDLRRHIISRFPLFDPKLGERTETGQAPYTLAGLDSDAAHVWVMVRPGEVVAVANAHLTSDPFGPDVAASGAPLADVLAAEAETRVPEVAALAGALAPVAAAGVPVVVTGDFNSASHRDWVAARVGALPQIVFPVEWPVTVAMEAAGFTDAFRAAHPDPAARPGITYSPGFPHPVPEPGQVMDRIDYVWAANAEVLAAQVVGEAGNPDVDIAVTPWPSDHRAVVADLRVVPVTAPALIAVEPRQVPEGESFLVRVNSPARADWTAVVVPRGAPAEQGVVGVTGVKAFWQPSIKLASLGLAPGPWDAVMLSPEGAEIARTRFSIAPAGGRASLDLADGTLGPGEDLTVRWAGAPGFRFDWIGIYPRGTWDVYAYLAFAYTGATLEGEMTLTPDLYYETLPPGEYEARLMADDHYVTLAIAPFTVTAE